eukprot:904965-Pelagomonas_calceolata.AAC.2
MPCKHQGHAHKPKQRKLGFLQCSLAVLFTYVLTTHEMEQPPYISSLLTHRIPLRNKSGSLGGGRHVQARHLCGYKAFAGCEYRKLFVGKCSRQSGGLNIIAHVSTCSKARCWPQRHGMCMDSATKAHKFLGHRRQGLKSNESNFQI